MRLWGILVGGAALGSAIAHPAAAQTELGVDLAFQVTNYASSSEFIELDNVRSINFPTNYIRLGVFVTPQVSVEPRLGVNRSTSGGQSVSSTQVLVSGYYHFPEMGPRRAAFARFGLGASILGGSAVGDTQMLVEAGVGVKFPARDKLLLRLEAFAGRAFESDMSRAATRLGAAFGFSWFSAG
ncbi:MAG: outer membrane beta-barrel protein [Longimicrobiales bacterium]